MFEEFVETLTVEKARSLLANNGSNRPVKKHLVKRYKRQIEKGRWVLSPVPIIITKSGKLGDGQHRCLGVVAADKPIQVTFAVIPDEKYDEIYNVIDIGAGRSLSDTTRTNRLVVQPISFLLRAAMNIRNVEVEDLQPFLNGRLGNFLTSINEIKCNNSMWRKSNFRAAAAAAVMAGKIDEVEAVELIRILMTEEISYWPPLFSKLYMQLTQPEMNLSKNGRSLENELFMRSYFTFVNYDRGVTTVQCRQSFRMDMKADVFSAVYQASPETFD